MIKTIIFDLGGVLYRINHERTREALAALAVTPEAVLLKLEEQADVFSNYESGKLTSAEFRDSLRTSYGMTASDEQIDHAWNAMLGGIFPYSIDLIQSLNNRYKLYILSNINDIHFKAIEQECAALFGCFDECFFRTKSACASPIPISIGMYSKPRIQHRKLLFLSTMHRKISSLHNCSVLRPIM